MSRLQRFARSLRGRILLSHLVVLAAGMGALVASMSMTAPAFYGQHLRFMMGGHGVQHRMMQQVGRGYGPGWLAGQSESALNDLIGEALTDAFFSSLRSALWVSAALGIAVALAASFYISARMVRRTREISRAASRIAQGHYQERLEQSGGDEIAELARDFNRMAQSLEHAEERRTQLLADVAHELRTPLTTVEGYMEGLIDGVVPAAPETFALVRQEAERLRYLVDDLRELSRAEAGTVALSLEPILPQKIIAKATAHMEPLLAEKGVALHTDCPEDLPAVQADASRALQILLNLLTNSLHYTPAGGRIEITAELTNREVRFAISDTGIGISAEDLPYVFGRFFRTDRSRSRRSGGSGLGLAISQYLVEAQRGRLWAESPGPDQGSTFYFTLPLWRAA